MVKKSKVPFKSPLNRQERLEEVEIHYKVGKHQNIVELIGAWEQKGYLYLQTELCEKGRQVTIYLLFEFYVNKLMRNTIIVWRL